jgi:hypothetical protein
MKTKLYRYIIWVILLLLLLANAAPVAAGMAWVG